MTHPMLQRRKPSFEDSIVIYHHSLCNILQDVVPKFPTKCDVEWVDAEDPLFLLYTSGSTGKPKVLVVKLDYLVISFVKYQSLLLYIGCVAYFWGLHGVYCNNL
jgi:acyl-coenzyme A synthetase/AMP-(fatty) acid ligase